jgi:GNAT superfamily N-acetyltransferase
MLAQSREENDQTLHSDSPQIRAAKLNDAAAIADLSTELGYPTSAGQSLERLQAVLERDDHAVLVACPADSSVVGWVHVFVAHRIESDAFAELGGFVVAEQHRGGGIGRALLVAAKEWVVARGIAKLRVRSRSGRVEAHAFYERLGFTLSKEQHVYEKDVVPIT